METLMTQSRKYIPQIGQRITLKLFAYYTAQSLPAWTHLIVEEVRPDLGWISARRDGDTESGKYAFKLDEIAPPVGWEPRYTITVAPDDVEKILSWFERGMVCRLTHDLNPYYMPIVWQPLDNSEQPNWKFPEVTDTIKAEDCRKLIRVVRLDDQDINFVNDPGCTYCSGSGRRPLQQVADARGCTLAEAHALAKSDERFFRSYDEASGLFDCHCSASGFRKLGRSKRAKLIKEWEADGWKTEYVNHGEDSYWHRTRETVVHDWEA